MLPQMPQQPEAGCTHSFCVFGLCLCLNRRLWMQKAPSVKGETANRLEGRSCGSTKCLASVYISYGEINIGAVLFEGECVCCLLEYLERLLKGNFLASGFLAKLSTSSVETRRIAEILFVLQSHNHGVLLR